MPQDEGVQNGAGGLFVLRVESRYSFELKSEVVVGAAFVLSEKMHTRVSINLLKQVYATTHPGANLNRPPVMKGQDTEAAAELMAALEAERMEDDV